LLILSFSELKLELEDIDCTEFTCFLVKSGVFLEDDGVELFRTIAAGD
jgi:hypothetical protein